MQEHAYADALAPVSNPDGTIDRLAVGEAEQARRCGSATPEQLAALDWLCANGGGIFVAVAAAEFHERLGERIRAHGGTIETKTTRNGQTTTTRRVDPPRVTLARSIQQRAARPRERRSGPSSSTSSADPGDDGDLPLPPPTCEQRVSS